MKLIKLVEESLKDDSNVELQITLLDKRTVIEREISSRKGKIEQFKNEDDIQSPAKAMKAEQNLKRVLIDRSSSFDSLINAFMAKEQTSKATEANPEIEVLVEEVDVLESLLKAFPTVKEIKAIGEVKETK